MLTNLLTIRNSHKLVMAISLFLSHSLNAQTNLVPNPSFEQYTNCPNNTQGVYLQKSSKPDYWYKPDLRNALYSNKCTNNQPLDGIPYNRAGGGISYQYPRTGDGYFTMFYDNGVANSCNYIQIKLSDSLKLNKKYYAEYFISLSNTFNLACNNQAMLFTNNAVYADTVNHTCFLQGNPQITNYSNPIVTDTMGWVKVSGIFKAQGGEQYLTLGNFKGWINTQRKIIQTDFYDGSAYYVDDVAVYNLDSFCLKADAGKDAILRLGDSIFIGSYTNGIDTLLWLENGITRIDSLRPGFWVKPTAIGTNYYVLQQTVNGCFSSDTVYLNTILPLSFISYHVITTKEKFIKNIWQTSNEINVSHFNIQRSVNGKDFKSISKLKANNNLNNEYEFIDSTAKVDLENVLYYRIECIDKDGSKQYSTTKQVNIDKQKNINIHIYPNPAKDIVTITSNTIIKEIEIINKVGQILQKKKPNLNKQSMNFSLFPKDTYIIKTLLDNGKIEVQQLILQ